MQGKSFNVKKIKKLSKINDLSYLKSILVHQKIDNILNIHIKYLFHNKLKSFPVYVHDFNSLIFF